MHLPRCLAVLLLLLLGNLHALGAAEPSVVDLKARIASNRANFTEVLPWLDTDEPDLQRLLLEAALQRADWRRDAVRWLRDCLDRPEAGDERERRLTGVLQTFAGVEAIQQLVTQTLTRPDLDRRTRVQLLQCLGRTRLDALPEAWVGVLEKLLRDDDAAVLHEAVFTVKARGVERCDAALRAIARHAEHPAEIRLAALECLAPRQRGWEPAAFDFLRCQLKTARPGTAQAAAARALGTSRLSAAQLSQLTEDWPRLPQGIVSLLLPAYSRSKDEAVGMAVLAALEKMPAPALTLGELDRALAGYPNAVHVRFRPLRARYASTREPLERLERDLPPGDAGRGKLVFQSQKAGCTACHRAAGQGGAVGPNLSRIGVIRGHRDLLEAIAFPEAYVAPEFRAYLAALDSGQIHHGLLLHATSDAVWLRTAPGAHARLARHALEEFVPTAQSLMPRGFDRLLSRQELSDLLEFLVQQR